MSLEDTDLFLVNRDRVDYKKEYGEIKSDIIADVETIEGKSAYDIAVENGFVGTEEQWLESLKGEEGPEGKEGPKGDAFTYDDFTPEQLAGLKGDQGDEGQQGEKGDPFVYDDFTPEQLEGLRGEPGEPGEDSTITVGQTTTGLPGTEASVVNTGTDSAAVLEFTIPQGEKGNPGDSFANLKGSVPEPGDLPTDPEQWDLYLVESEDQYTIWDGEKWRYVAVGGVNFWEDLLNKPDTFPPDPHTHSYNDLTDKPTIGNGRLTIYDHLGDEIGVFSANQTGSTEIDLPRIPVVNNGQLVIKDGSGVELGTFRANQANDTEIEIATGDSFSGSYNDLTDQPEINDGELLIYDWEMNAIGRFTANQKNKSTVFLPKPGSGDDSFSGSWNDLTDKPSCFDACWHYHSYLDLSDLPLKFPPEDHTHSYNDLTNRPTIGDGKITINQAGQKKGEFTVNQTGPTIINLTDTDTRVDAYTKAESDQRFMPLDLRTLNQLN